MNHDERRTLLRDLSGLISDADATGDILQTFLPIPRHSLVLREQIMVIRGERGAGKTALFHFLLRAKDKKDVIQGLYPDAYVEGVRWIEGFSEAIRHPTTAELDEFGKQADDASLRLFWMAHLACRLQAEGFGAASSQNPVYATWQAYLHEPSRWVGAAHERLGALTQWVDGVDGSLSKEQRTVFVTYDHLDKIGLFDAGVRGRYAGTLLALWMSLANRYRRLRPKVFMREDLFVEAQRSFADASKLESRSITLDWDVETLYRLLIRHMAALSPELRNWIQRGGKSIPLEERPPWGWMPPDTLRETGRISQKTFVDHLAGEQMGQGIKKGYTYRWIPNRLQDAHVRIVPRSLLNLIGFAAKIASTQPPEARWDHLLHPSELSAALVETSRKRVDELAEEHKIVARLANLSGMTVTLEAKKVERLLAKPVPDKDDGFGNRGDSVMDELIRLGVLKVRLDGRIDVPDIYRYGFAIKRKGGVARPR